MLTSGCYRVAMMEFSKKKKIMDQNQKMKNISNRIIKEPDNKESTKTIIVAHVKAS